MLIGFPPIFVEDTKIIYSYSFIDPLVENSLIYIELIKNKLIEIDWKLTSKILIITKFCWHHLVFILFQNKFVQCYIKVISVFFTGLLVNVFLFDIELWLLHSSCRVTLVSLMYLFHVHEGNFFILIFVCSCSCFVFM